MSHENDRLEQAQKARERYSSVTQLGTSEKNDWERQRIEIHREIQKFRTIRSFYHMLNARGEAYDHLNIFLNASETLKTVRAAELFPDEPKPIFFVAWNVSDEHEDIRELEKKADPRLGMEQRISGEVIVLKDETKHFLCDPLQINSGDTKLRTKKNYLEVANILLNEGYIPVDAEFNIIPIKSLDEEGWDVLTGNELYIKIIQEISDGTVTRENNFESYKYTVHHALSSLVGDIKQIRYGIECGDGGEEVEEQIRKDIALIRQLLGVAPDALDFHSGEDREEMVEFLKSEKLI